MPGFQRTLWTVAMLHCRGVLVHILMSGFGWHFPVSTAAVAIVCSVPGSITTVRDLAWLCINTVQGQSGRGSMWQQQPTLRVCCCTCTEAKLAGVDEFPHLEEPPFAMLILALHATAAECSWPCWPCWKRLNAGRPRHLCVHSQHCCLCSVSTPCRPITSSSVPGRPSTL